MATVVVNVGSPQGITIQSPAEAEDPHDPLSTFTPGGVTIPGVKLAPSKYCEGLFVKNQLKKGSVIHQQECAPGTNMRDFYTFHGAINHKCKPSCYWSEVKENVFSLISIHDIPAESEITCDYSTFAYECVGDVIESCSCGSENCLGSVAGFQNLTIEQATPRLPRVSAAVLEAWLTAHPEVYYHDLDPTIPEGVDVLPTRSHGGPTKKMIATRDVEEGGCVFKNTSIYLQPEGKLLIVTINGECMEMDFLTHTINRNDGFREFYGFDSYMNHSCNPNARMDYFTKTEYQVTATRNIKAGESLTCDYETFDTLLDGTVFDCNCKAYNCRGKVYA